MILYSNQCLRLASFVMDILGLAAPNKYSCLSVLHTPASLILGTRPRIHVGIAQGSSKEAVWVLDLKLLIWSGLSVKYEEMYIALLYIVGVWQLHSMLAVILF